MDENTKVFDHPSGLGRIIYELETIGVKIDNEGKALRFILCLSSSY